MLYRINNGTLSLGGREILSHADFEIKGRDKAAIVGANGAGKTTLLRLIAGELSLDADDKRKEPGIEKSGNITVGLLSQTGISDREQTVEEYCLKLFRRKTGNPAAENEIDFQVEFDKMITGFGFALADKRKKIEEFSGGEQTKISMIGLLLERPELLLLDEPTNHLDMNSIQWLENYIKAYPKAVCMVSHDRFFLDECASVIYEMQGGKLTKYPGNYTDFRREKEKRRERARKACEAYEKEQERLESLIERFKNKPKKAAFTRSRKKIMERMEVPDQPDAPLEAPLLYGGEPSVPGSKKVLDTEDLMIGYEKTLLTVSMRIRRGQKIGILGDNGAGKSTFLKTIAGRLAPLSGKMTVGNHVSIGYFDQFTALTDSGNTLLEDFHGRFPSLTEKEARSYLAGFLFPGKMASAKIADLSGGEKSRYALSCLLYECPNFLLLDEPTNHMDIRAKERLELALKTYKGTLLFVSHDRYLLSELADSLLVFQEGQIYEYPFGYRHYLERIKQGGNCGSDMKALVLAKDKKLIDDMRSVPRSERHESRPLSDEEAYEEWKLESYLTDLKAKEKEYVYLLEQEDRILREIICSEEYWNSAPNLPLNQDNLKVRTAEEEYTKACLAWYDEYLEIIDP